MGTLIALHAHPDDEAITTGGSMARAVDEGHRVVLVVATNGDHGEVPDDLADGETLADRRRAETDRSAAALGVHVVEWLGFSDSGMTGWEQNGDPDSFHQADLDDAAGRLLAVIERERRAVPGNRPGDLVVTCYDWHGTYGHPDHVKVHQVGRRAAELASDAGIGLRVLEATANRDEMIRTMTLLRESGAEVGNPDADGEGEFDPNAGADDGNPFGEPESVITLRVDVRDHIDRKRASLAAHRSQISDSSFFVEMPDHVFAAVFGDEWFIEHDRWPPVRTGWIFDDPS